jgi:hypothetical protein
MNVGQIRMISMVLIGYISLSAAPALSELETMGIEYFHIDVHTQQMENFNSDMNEHGLPEFNSVAPAFGFGKTVAIRRFISESSLNLLFWPEEQEGLKKATYKYGYGVMKGGFDVLPLGMPVQVYPYIGIGAGLFLLGVYDAETTFDGMVISEPDQTFISQATFLFDFGVGFNFIYTTRWKKNRGVLGIRIGYVYDVRSRDDWNSWGTDITGGPRTGGSGFYTRFILGKWREKIWSTKKW